MIRKNMAIIFNNLLITQESCVAIVFMHSRTIVLTPMPFWMTRVKKDLGPAKLFIKIHTQYINIVLAKSKINDLVLGKHRTLIIKGIFKRVYHPLSNGRPLNKTTKWIIQNHFREITNKSMLTFKKHRYTNLHLAYKTTRLLK